MSWYELSLRNRFGCFSEVALLTCAHMPAYSSSRFRLIILLADCPQWFSTPWVTSQLVVVEMLHHLLSHGPRDMNSRSSIVNINVRVTLIHVEVLSWL